jgi:hypothetical protein
MKILTALVISYSIHISIDGVVAGTYIILALLGMNVFLTVYSASVLMGTFVYILKNPDMSADILTKNSVSDEMGLQLLIRLMLLACVYHIYSLGYHLFAGIALTTVFISVLSNIVQLFMNQEIPE